MKTLPNPAWEVADVFALYGQKYKHEHKLPPGHRNTMFAIQNCRTSVLGGHIDKCDNCEHTLISYNSCRNRHCPKCQGLSRIKWMDKLTSTLLPVRYFHIVFTIPSELNPLVLVNQKCLYNILFKAASQSLLALAQDPKHLGAQTGLIAVLHTWGQNLMEHPHLHTIVPAGGWNPTTQYWQSSGKKFFIPVKVISALFKGKFLAMLKHAWQQNQLTFEGQLKSLQPKNNFQQLLDLLYDKNKKWVVFAKPHFKNTSHIINYLGRYTHRVAISNDRIISIEQGSVTFKWKDYQDKEKQKTMKLPANEFIRRFLLHILPKGFCKIRYYGIFACRNHKSDLFKCRKVLRQILAKPKLEGLSWIDLVLTLTGKNLSSCPLCKKSNMVLDRFFIGKSRPPP